MAANGKRQVESSTKPRPAPSAEELRINLRKYARRGGITLVVGAGVSIPRGVPNWEYLARAIWKKGFGKTGAPWAGKGSSGQVSQFLPIIFELVYRKLGQEKFIESLKENLYAGVEYPGDDRTFKSSSESLAVIARVIFQEYRRKAGRRIDAVITLNADDLIEQAVNTFADARTLRDPFGRPIVQSIARSTHFDPRGHVFRPIPVYHIHGFLPSERSAHFERFDQTFVFTDTQYWSTSASALTFANRVMASALSEGRCVFIGLSMTDINLLRWLALRTIERDRDYAETTTKSRPSPLRLRTMNIQFERHFWIRPASDDPNGFLTRFLRERGINAIEIDSWAGKDFRNLMEECFDPPAPVKRTTSNAQTQK
jgi:hypothetical protein